MMLAPGASVHAVRPLQWLLDRDCRVLFVDDVRPRTAAVGRFSHALNPLGAGRREWLGWRLSHRVALAELRWLRWRSRADVIHVHWVDARARACVAAGLRPLVLTVWGSDINLLLTDGADPSDRRAVGEALAAADLVIADSAEMPAKCAALAGRPVPMVILPLGIDTNLFKPASAETVAAWRQRLNVPDDATVFMSVRAWGPRYGHGEILEAFAQARALSRRRLVLIFKVYNTKDYPEAAALEARLRQRVVELGLHQDVRWLSEVAVDELPAMYGLADVVINCPSLDAFPVTFIEAAACQCPVITVDLPAYRGTFVHDFFRIVPPDDTAALAGAMRDQAECNPIEARVRLAAARVLMTREFDEKVTADRLIGHYAQVIRDHRKGSRQPAVATQ